MTTLTLFLLSLLTTFSAWAQVPATIELQERGIFPQQKAVLVGDVDPAAPLISIFVLTPGQQGLKPDYVLTASPGKKKWEQEINFPKSHGYFAIHIFKQKDKFTPAVKVINLSYTFGYRLSAQKTSNSRLEIAGVSSEADQKWIVRVQKNDSATYQDYLFKTEGSSWREKLTLRDGPGDYSVDVFTLKSGETKAFTRVAQLKVSNTDSESRAELLPSALVQSEDIRLIKLAQEIAGESTEAAEKIRLIHDWVGSNIAYDLEMLRRRAKAEKSILFVDSISVLKSRASLCEGYAALTAALLRALKVPTRIIHGLVTEGEHAWNEVWLQDQWLPMDVTWDAGTVDPKANDGLGLFQPGLRHNYFLKSEEEFAKDHQKISVSPN